MSGAMLFDSQMWLLLKNLLFTLVAPCTAAVYIPLLITRGRSAGAGPMSWLALTLLAVGASIYAWCLWDFATFGRGTPAPIDAPKRLVVRGLYQYTRNPMYLGVLTAILGWTLLYRSLPLLAYGAILGLSFHLFVVLYEEPHLRAIFPDQYPAYCSRAGRWLPRFPRRQGAL